MSIIVNEVGLTLKKMEYRESLLSNHSLQMGKTFSETYVATVPKWVGRLHCIEFDALFGVTCSETNYPQVI